MIDNKVMGGIIGLIILSCMTILNVNIIFTKEAMIAKLLAGGSLILLLILVIPSCVQIFKYIKQKQIFF